MQNPHAHLQIVTKGPAKLQIDLYKNVGEVPRTRYPPSVFKCLSRERGITPQGEPRQKKRKRKKKKKNMGPLTFHADTIYKISGS